MKKLIAATAIIAVMSGGVALAASSSANASGRSQRTKPKAGAGFGREIQALAHLSGKTADQILGQFGVTPDQLRAEMKKENHAAAKQRRDAVAVLAKLTGKSPNEIKALAKPGVKLQDVLKQLNVTQEQFKAAMKDAARKANKNQRVVEAISTLTGKSTAEIKALIKPGVKVNDVLKQLGLTPDQVRQAMKGAK